MRTTRRDFIKNFSITLASLVLTRCSIFRSKTENARDQIRDCWARLDWLAEETRNVEENTKQASDAYNELIYSHQAALDTLISSGEIDSAVGGEMQRAFREAARYVKSSNEVVVMCYEAAPDLPPSHLWSNTVREDLIRQTELLESYSGEFESTTLQKALDAIARDISFLQRDGESDLSEALYQEYQTSDMYVSPEALRAAELLVEIILGE